MKARLVEFRDDRRLGSTTLRGETRIGRDASCEIFCDYARVSRVHAIVHGDDADHTLHDAGSSNGTTLNGAAIGSTPVPLNPGDVVALADEVSFVYELAEDGLDPKVLGLSAAAVLTLAAVALIVALCTGSGDAVYDEATELAREAIAASEQGDHETVKLRLRKAAGLLFKAGHLDDVPRGEVLREGLQRVAEQMDDEPPLVTLFEASLAAADAAPVERARESPTSEPSAAAASDGCALDRAPASELVECVDYWIRQVLRELHQDPDSFPPHLPAEVAQRISAEHGLLGRSLERGAPLVPMLRRELEAERMPVLLHYVALIESSYRPTAGSPAGAVGLWQFMPATGRRYDLRVDGTIDERRDPGKSTRAAAKYLKELAFEFGGNALLLALAGYNAGENGVQRSLKKLDDPFSERSYWTLVDRELIPEETRHYVTRFIAAAVAGEGGLPSAETLEAAGFGPVRR